MAAGRKTRPRTGTVKASGGPLPNIPKSVFIRVTGQRYDNMEARVRRKGFPGLPFDKEAFREHLLRKLGGQYHGFVRCPYCTGFFAVEQIGFDHAIPLSRGGGAELSNLDLPCQPCNAKKGGMTPEEFILLLEFLDTRIPLAKEEVLNRLAISVPLAAGARANAAVIGSLKQSGVWQQARLALSESKRRRRGR